MWPRVKLFQNYFSRWKSSEFFSKLFQRHWTCWKIFMSCNKPLKLFCNNFSGWNNFEIISHVKKDTEIISKLFYSHVNHGITDDWYLRHRYSGAHVLERLFTRAWFYHTNHLGGFYQIYKFGAVGDRNKLVKFWGQKVKGQGHDETEYDQNVRFRAVLSSQNIALSSLSSSSYSFIYDVTERLP